MKELDLYNQICPIQHCTKAEYTEYISLMKKPNIIYIIDDAGEGDPTIYFNNSIIADYNSDLIKLINSVLPNEAGNIELNAGDIDTYTKHEIERMIRERDLTEWIPAGTPAISFNYRDATFYPGILKNGGPYGYEFSTYNLIIAKRESSSFELPVDYLDPLSPDGYAVIRSINLNSYDYSDLSTNFYFSRTLPIAWVDLNYIYQIYTPASPTTANSRIIGSKLNDTVTESFSMDLPFRVNGSPDYSSTGFFKTMVGSPNIHYIDVESKRLWYINSETKEIVEQTDIDFPDLGGEYTYAKYNGLMIDGFENPDYQTVFLNVHLKTDPSKYFILRYDWRSKSIEFIMEHECNNIILLDLSEYVLFMSDLNTNISDSSYLGRDIIAYDRSDTYYKYLIPMRNGTGMAKAMPTYFEIYTHSDIVGRFNIYDVLHREWKNLPVGTILYIKAMIRVISKNVEIVNDGTIFHGDVPPSTKIKILYPDTRILLMQDITLDGSYIKYPSDEL